MSLNDHGISSWLSMVILCSAICDMTQNNLQPPRQQNRNADQPAKKKMDVIVIPGKQVFKTCCLYLKEH
uniref:Secreted protein n=1 Tax=Pyxicephalus adspersus TaxID=30357 RepID=A0AAV3A6E6_PYXAD|nr:TPA: hypothetical protein GDO54_010924 [Pyxicephalus adspersus]